MRRLSESSRIPCQSRPTELEINFVKSNNSWIRSAVRVWLTKPKLNNYKELSSRKLILLTSVIIGFPSVKRKSKT